MATLPVYDRTGAHAGELEAAPAVFGVEPNAAVLYQVVVADLAAQRQGTASTKTRSEVAGSTRKLWRQKGTGRARVGDRRPPSRVGGGVAAGPRPRSYRQDTPARMKLAALRAALSTRAAAGDVIVIEAVELPEAKTKALQGLLNAIGLSGDLLLVLAERDQTIWRCGRNIEGLQIAIAQELTARDVMASRKIILAQGSISRLEARLA